MKNKLKSAIVKRSVTVAGVKTSVSLEAPFWDAFKEIAQQREQHVNELVSELNQDRDNANLSSVVRLFVLHYFQNRPSP